MKTKTIEINGITIVADISKTSVSITSDDGWFVTVFDLSMSVKIPALSSEHANAIVQDLINEQLSTCNVIPRSMS